MSGDMDHVLLTRFNLPTVGFERLVRAKEGWLEERLILFERYCIPSVQAQTHQAFHWLVYFDPESPEWLKRRIQVHATHKLYTPVFRESVNESELLSDIRGLELGGNGRLLTSNLDNDDALAVDFVERVQESAPKRGKTVVYLVSGMIKSGPHVYLRMDRSNAFRSVVSDWAAPSSCWSNWHTLLSKDMPSLELNGGPAWLQVVHSLNVSNRVHGRLVSPDRYHHLFPGLLDDVRSPELVERVVDVCVLRPRRFVRDAGRTVLKSIALRLLGKRSLDKAKILLASMSRR
jgi:hypothetical protein